MSVLASWGRQENPPERNDTGPVFGQLGVQVASNFISLELAIKLQWMGRFIERGYFYAYKSN